MSENYEVCGVINVLGSFEVIEVSSVTGVGRYMDASAGYMEIGDLRIDDPLACQYPEKAAKALTEHAFGEGDYIGVIFTNSGQWLLTETQATFVSAVTGSIGETVDIDLNIEADAEDEDEVDD